MGATLWHHVAPWHADANVALKALQADFFVENYDLAALLPIQLASARESVRAAERDGDKYGLVGIYRDRVKLLESLCAHPIPDSPHARIEILRRIESAIGSEIGNVLDVVAVADQRKSHTAQQLSAHDVKRLVGVARPVYVGRRQVSATGGTRQRGSKSARSKSRLRPAQGSINEMPLRPSGLMSTWNTVPSGMSSESDSHQRPTYHLMVRSPSGRNSTMESGA
jgi:hypothetical protein